MIKSVYFDTSIFGGYFEHEFSESTVDFFDRIINDQISVFISEMLVSELYGAPENVKELIHLIPEGQKINISLTPEAEKLARTYISENVVGKTSLADCLHIALATIHHADILVSWNFKHIVNIERIRGYNSGKFKTGLFND